MDGKPVMKKDPPSAEGVALREWVCLAASAFVPLSILLGLYLFEIPLGKPGEFVYRYSPFLLSRLAVVPAAFLVALLCGAGTWLLASDTPRRRHGGLALVAVGVTLFAVWAYWAPPYHIRQHFFNMQSPSHDGAFLHEAEVLLAEPDYLARFPVRARTPPEVMRGTRVISNPPGATLLAAATIRARRGLPPVARGVDWLIGNVDTGTPETHGLLAESLAFSVALVAAWLLSTVVLYWLGRLFLPPPSAAAFAVCTFASPMTLLFTPGKDPAQLLTVAVPLWLWLLAVRKRRVWAASLAGATAVPAAMMGLVHVWVAAVVGLVCLLGARSTTGGMRALCLRCIAPAAGGAAAVALGLFVLCDWNVLATGRAVAASQAEVTRGADAMPFVWQTLGIPLFLLFAGPALWATALWQLGRRRRTPDRSDARLGSHLFLVTAVVLVLTVGFTNLETPRLWIPFLPLLLLGSLLRGPFVGNAGRKRALFLAVLVTVQISCSAAQWCLMDARETEYRLLPDEHGHPRFFH